MKTILQYLTEQKDMAWHNRLCYSKTYSMETPKEGYEKNFAEAVRDCVLIDEIIQIVTEAQDVEGQKNIKIYLLENHAGHQFRQAGENLIQAKRLLCLRLGEDPTDKDCGIDSVKFVQVIS